MTLVAPVIFQPEGQLREKFQAHRPRRSLTVVNSDQVTVRSRFIPCKTSFRMYGVAHNTALSAGCRQTFEAGEMAMASCVGG